MYTSVSSGSVSCEHCSRNFSLCLNVCCTSLADFHSVTDISSKSSALFRNISPVSIVTLTAQRSLQFRVSHCRESLSYKNNNNLF
jgi:hypothetical protein